VTLGDAACGRRPKGCARDAARFRAAARARRCAKPTQEGDAAACHDAAIGFSAISSLLSLPTRADSKRVTTTAVNYLSLRLFPYIGPFRPHL
jgi:hypothetical protein